MKKQYKKMNLLSNRQKPHVVGQRSNKLVAEYYTEQVRYGQLNQHLL